MTDHRFDELTKALGKTASRRTVFKGALAAALGGALTRVGGNDADAFRGRSGCSRLGQDCGGTNPGCCSSLICDDATSTCLTPVDQPCIEDSDCAGDNVCRPFGSFSYHCQALGEIGEQCADSSDCAEGLSCDEYSGTCLDICFGIGANCEVDEDCCDILSCVEGSCGINIGICGTTGMSCFPFECCPGYTCVGDIFTGTCQPLG